MALEVGGGRPITLRGGGIGTCLKVADGGQGVGLGRGAFGAAVAQGAEFLGGERVGVTLPDDFAVAHGDGVRDAFDAESLGEGTRAVDGDGIGGGRGLFGEKVEDFRIGALVPDVHADEAHTFVAQFTVERLKVGHGADARAAPPRPTFQHGEPLGPDGGALATQEVGRQHRDGQRRGTKGNGDKHGK